MISKTLRIATRQSPLALWQAHFVREQLLKHWPMMNIELLPMTTSGDQFLKTKLLAAGGKGLFVKELEEALLQKRADIAVHSTKDMPISLPAGLQISAFYERENPLDAFISHEYSSLDNLPKHAVIGTASLRRQSQLLAYRPDLQIKTLRGNVNTRLAKLAAKEFDAIILAAAGLERLSMHASITALLSEEIMLPTCGQGALCIESRVGDKDIEKIIAPLNHPLTALCIETERAVNAHLGGNCHVPLGVFCRVMDENRLYLRAKVLQSDGSHWIASARKGPLEQASTLAEQCTQDLLAQGAEALIKSSLT